MFREAGRIGLVLATAMLGGCVQDLFFYPDQRVYTTASQVGVEAHELQFKTADGSRLHGLWLPAAPTATPTCTVVHAHGNAANISNHLPLVAWLPAQGINVLMFDYRGFGRSEGRPSLDGLVEDVEAAIAIARGQPKVHPDRIILFGQSLGGATALRAAQRSKPGTLRGLVLDSAFASYRGIAHDVARQHPLLKLLSPVVRPLLPSADDDPVTAIARLQMPVWLVHGERDDTIGVTHSEQLFAAAHDARQLLRVPGGQHLDALTRPDFRLRFLALLAEACGTLPASPH